MKVQTLDNFLATIIGKMDIVIDNLTGADPQIGSSWCIFDIRARIQNFHKSLKARQTFLERFRKVQNV